MAELYIGLISGTSIDAIDAVLADFGGAPQVVATASYSFPEQVRKELHTICNSGICPMDKLGELDRQLGLLFGTAVNKLLESAGVKRADVRAIGSHGQTIHHAPHGEIRYTIQIGDPNTIAELTGITTVADFRRRDIAAGGQGAPLVPPFHAAAFRSTGHDRVVLNIGGIANITVLPRDAAQPVIGFDTGPGNGLLDAWVQKHRGEPFDRSGAWAASGKVDTALLKSLLKDGYFDKDPPKSTGREYFNLAWLEHHLTGSASSEKEDVQATLCELTAITIAQDIRQYAPATKQIMVCGGGAYNSALMKRLATLMSDCEVTSTANYGIAPDWIEATAFAWLARATLGGQAGNLPSVTGAHHAVVLGGIYAGNRSQDRY